MECWSRDKPVSRLIFSLLHIPILSQSHVGPSIEPAFEIVDILVANAQNAVHMTCESIWCRITGVPEKNKKQAINPNL